MGNDTSGVHVWLVLWKACAALRHHAGPQQVDALGVGQSEFRVLEILLAKGPPARQRDRPEGGPDRRLHQRRGGPFWCAKGLVRRRDDASDRRVRLVELTDKGKAVIVSGFQSHREAMEAAAADLPASERATLIRLLKKLGKGAESQWKSQADAPRQRRQASLMGSRQKTEKIVR